jgi:hypothetical protein
MYHSHDANRFYSGRVRLSLLLLRLFYLLSSVRLACPVKLIRFRPYSRFTLTSSLLRHSLRLRCWTSIRLLRKRK